MKLHAIRTNLVVGEGPRHSLVFGLDGGVLRVQALVRFDEPPQHRPEPEVKAPDGSDWWRWNNALEMPASFVEGHPAQADHGMWLIVQQKRNSLTRLVPYYQANQLTREHPFAQTQRTGANVLGGILVPRARAPLSECVAWVNVSSDDFRLFPVGDVQVVSSPFRNADELRAAVFPSVSVTGPRTLSPTTASCKLSVQLVDAAGQPAARSAEVYLEPVNCALSRTRVVLSEAGSAVVTARFDDLRPGDVARVKAGFKHFSGKAEWTAEIV